jgi:hypothetical protein
LWSLTWYIRTSQPLFGGHEGYFCLEPHEAKRLRHLEIPEPWPGAYDRAIRQTPQRGPEDRTLFSRLLVRLDALAVQLKSLPLVLAAISAETDTNKRAAFKRDLSNGLGALFAEQVTLDGANREPLFAPAVALMTTDEIVSKILEWPKIARFGCVIPVGTEAAKNQGYAAEVLIRPEAGSPLIMHMMIKGAIQGEGAVISGIWISKLGGAAKGRFADKHKEGCGDKKPYWFPWQEVDEALAQGNSAPKQRAVRTAKHMD